MMHFSRKNAVTILIAILFLGAYGAALFYTKRLERDVRTKATELAGEITREASMESLGGFLDELAVDQKRLEGFFVSPDAAVSMIETVEALGTTIGAKISISGVEVVEPNAEGEGTMIMTINAEGSWREMTRLLALLDTFPFASHTQNASLLRGGSDEGSEARAWSLRSEFHIFLRRS
ncbi:MAG: hypothetical protein KBD16_03390 [Candidatus Pacebacteria bacterium]|nr:hypothetical protein [Candidatus Paceibacterota bacterium]